MKNIEPPETGPINLGNPREFAGGTRSRQMYCRAGGSATLRHSPIESPIESSGGRHGEGSDAQQQRKEEAEAGQE
jgi:hypothetical protein